jgi:nicotinamide-nucleotide amidase
VEGAVETVGFPVSRVRGETHPGSEVARVEIVCAERWKEIVARIAVGWPEKRLLAVAESCTGGMVGAAITTLPGVSRWFKGSIVAYHNQVKIEHLSTSDTLLAEFGAVSAECARSMSRGVRSLLSAQVGLALTGVAGPGGGADDKPVGLVFIALGDGDRESCERFQFQGDRNAIRLAAVEQALLMLENW